MTSPERKIGIIGYPAQHSLSPIFQQAALDTLNIDIKYEIWETHPDDLEAVVASLRAPNIEGANVTMPFKEKIVPFLDSLDLSAQQIGAVNTIVKSDGMLIGHNTDGIGFLEALGDILFTPQKKNILIIGAGGASRSIAFALAHENPSQIIIANRDKDRAVNLAQSLIATTPTTVVPIEFTTATLQEWIPKSDLIINATSIGMRPAEDLSPVPSMLIRKNIFVYDLVYNPIETVLVKSARCRGAVAAGGLSMLVYQGAHAFTLWTGMIAPRDLMMRTATAHIERPPSIG
tara:strand:- start:1754 stop:2620 length:867 start_codon:yes stop_codon:yes gene_type:complete